MEYFVDSQAQLIAELQRINVLIQAHIRRIRADQTRDPQFQGLYISDEEIDRLSAGDQGLPEWAAEHLPSDLQRAIDLISERNSAMASASLTHGIILRLDNVIRAFGLTQFDIDVLMIAIAPELDLRYEKFYAYLQDDVTRKATTVDLTLNLLCCSIEEKLQARSRFGHQSTLLQFSLIELREASHPNPSLLGRTVKADPGIVAYLLGGAIGEPRLERVARLVSPLRPFEDLLLPPETISGLRNFGTSSGLLYFHGPPGSGKKSCAEALCQERGINLLVFDSRHTAATGDLELTIRLLLRECRLHGALLFVDGFDALLEDTRRLQYDSFLHAIENHPGLTILAGEQTWEPAAFLLKRPFAQVSFGTPSFEARLTLWRRICGGNDEVDCDAVANQFSFTGGQILEAFAAATNLAKWRGGDEVAITTADLMAACRSRSGGKLATLATQITPSCKWSDLVLPAERLRQLAEISDAVRNRARVFDSWGFGRKVYGRGINILFSGSSGTGKTMAASAMAAELGAGLYKIDLSTVVSKYIGETEKNLSRIFLEARNSNAILFFDEADALFGKRTAVQDAHDRYANIETNYLLQKMEEHDGLAILATNLGKNMDEAFTRRLHATVEFPMPNIEDRLRIWEKVWPVETPLDPRLDLQFMAQRFEISGGNIRNIALVAAFLAAADNSGAVGMSHLIRATRLEYQKMRTVVTSLGFLEYPDPAVTDVT